MAKGERGIQTAIMNALFAHPKVAWAYVTTIGLFKGRGGQRINVGFPGQSDILGQMKDGRFLAIEVKQPGKVPTEDQYKFLDLVSKNNGVSGWADNIEDAIKIVDEKRITQN